MHFQIAGRQNTVDLEAVKHTSTYVITEKQAFTRWQHFFVIITYQFIVFVSHRTRILRKRDGKLYDSFQP